MATVDKYKIHMEVVGEQAVASATNALKTFGGVIAGLATLSFAKSVLTLADDMADLAESTGLSMAAVTGFSTAVAAAGGNFENAGKGIRTFYKNLVEAGGDQTSKAAESLRKVGITLDDIRTKSEGQLLVEAIDELAKMGAGAKQTAAMMELFGKGLAGVSPGALMELLKNTDAEGLAEKLTKVKDANDKMTAAMTNFKAASAGVLGALMPVFDGILVVVGLITKHLDVLAIAMGAVFGAAMLANIQKITTAMRAFAASNPFTLIAVAVGTLVVVVAELIDTYGSFGNAMKAVGNMGINLINTLMNGFAGLSQFIAGVMTGVGNAILAGLNPFGDKTAMGELEAGFRQGVNAFKKQMASEGAIKFKFDVQPVVKKKTGASALDALLADQGGLGESATGLTEKQAEARDKEALAAQQVTAQMKLQNDEANKLRQISIDTIGIESNRANLIKSNAQAESDSRKQIADLDAKIVAERAKGAQRNDDIIAQLQKQKDVVSGQLEKTLKLNEAEYQRLQLQKQIKSEIEYSLGNIELMEDALRDVEEYKTKSLVIQGKLSEDEAQRKLQLDSLRFDNQKKIAIFDAQIADAKKAKDTAEVNRLSNLRDLEDQRYDAAKDKLQENFVLQDKLNKSQAAGAVAALDNIGKQFEDYRMAQDAVTMGWSKVNDALDTFIQTGKFNFKDFASSIIGMLAKMVAQAMIFKYIFEPIMGALGLSSGTSAPVPIPGLATGGPAKAGKPYVVGEQGPELFVPKSAGSVIPNNKLPSKAEATGTGMVNAPITNNYITNNIQAVDAKSVAQLFAENRKTLLGSVEMARRELPYQMA